MPALALVALLQFSRAAVHAADVSGEIKTDTIWAASGSPYMVTDHVTVKEGVTLAIEPGTSVQFSQSTGLFIEGTLSAIGTVQNPISFTGPSPNPGSWRGIQVIDAGSAQMEWCHLSFAGYWDGAGLLKRGSGALVMKHSTLRGHAGDGLRISAGAVTFVSQNNVFEENTLGVRVGIGASFDDNTSTFTGNGMDVHLEGGTFSGQVIWNLKPEYSLYVADQINVATNGTLIVRPGTVVKFSQSKGLVVRGTIQVEGTAAQPVFLTEWRDDAAGGDANRDGNQSEPAPGFWRGLYIEPEGSGTLTHATLRYAGYWDSLGIRKTGQGTLTLNQCTLEKVGGSGLKVENSSGATVLQESRLTGNTESGLRLIAGQATASGCTFEGNGQYGILQDANDVVAYEANDFTGNAWGSVGVNGGALTGAMNWSKGKGESFSIVVRDHFNVPAETSLSIQPGVALHFAQNVGLFVKGTLTAIGTADAPIRFSGVTAAPGWWRGIQVTESGSADIEWSEVSSAGYWDKAGLLKTGTGGLILKNSILQGTAGDGLRIEAGYSAFVSRDNLFKDNTQGVRLGIDASFDDHTSSFAGNAMDMFADSGSVSGEVTWNLKPECSIYLSGHLTIASGGKLVIRPGTVVKMAQSAGLFVDGVLEAGGTAAEPIYLTDWRDDAVGGDADRDAAQTVPAPGWWRGIFIRSDGAASLSHCTLRYAGYWDSVGLHKSGTGSLRVVQSTITQVGGSGMRVENSSGLTTLESTSLVGNAHSGLFLASGPVAAAGCTFTDNGHYGIHQNAGETLDYALNNFARNAQGSVGVNGGTLGGAMSWSKGNGEAFTLVIRDHLNVPAGTSLAIQPGVAVHFAQAVGLFVTGTLTAAGTAENPIRFTGTTGTPNWWRGIQVSAAGSADLNWCEVSASGYWDGVGLLKTGSGALALNNSTLRGNGGDGLRIDGSTGAHQISGCSFISNSNGVLAKNQSSPIPINKGRFENNESHGVLNQGPAELDARQCWWGNSSGPYHATRNPQGTGNKVSDLVRFEPWQAVDSSGLLAVILEPAEACQAGAAWSVDGANWQNSGSTLALEPGTYTVQCRLINGWTAPATRSVSVTADDTTTVTSVYTRESQPPAGTILPGPTLNEPRMGHTIATLPDGRVILFGGHGTGFKALASAEVWNPQDERCTTLTMRHTHDVPAFAQLNDGRYLLAGGSADLGIPAYSEAELFDPTTDSFTATGSLVRFRSGSGAAALSGGQVLVAGAWWTHNDAHTYGELLNPATGVFTATSGLHAQRAHPIVLPTSGNRAVVAGGHSVTGGPYVGSVEEFNPATGGFETLQDELFSDDPGWGLRQDQRPIEAQKLADGRFLLLAHRTKDDVTEYMLFTFDPVQKRFERMAVTPGLPDSKEYVLWTPVVDAARGHAHLLAQSTKASSTEVSLLTVNVNSGALHQSAAPTVLDPAYSLAGAAIALLQDGRLFITGGSEDGSNFKPVRRTLFVTAGEAAPRANLVLGKTGSQGINLTWTAPADAFVLETSTDLIQWAEVTGVTSSGERHVLIVSTSESARFYRLRGVEKLR